MGNKFGKIGLFTGLITFVLLIFGVRNILGQTLEVKNYIAFAIFGLIAGIAASVLLFYKLKFAFPIFMIALVLGFIELFRNFIFNNGGWGDVIGILSLFMITSFGLVLALIVQSIVYFVQKSKKSE